MPTWIGRFSWPRWLEGALVVCGSVAILDLDRRMTISYVMNNMGTDVLGSNRAAAYAQAVYRAADAVIAVP